MIYLWSGTPGSGKSLHMAERIYYDIKMKRPVVANFEINRNLFKDSKTFFFCDNADMTPEKLLEFSRWWFRKKPVKEGTISLYIDECSLIFNARDWNREDRKAWVRFFQLHRKAGYNVYLISQMDGMIDKQIRALVEYHVVHRKVNNVGLFGKFVSLFALGHPVVCAVTYWYGQKMRLSAEWFLGRKKFFRMYDTFKLFDDVKDLQPHIQGEALAVEAEPGKKKQQKREKNITFISKSA